MQLDSNMYINNLSLNCPKTILKQYRVYIYLRVKIARYRKSLISHSQDHGFRVTEESFRVGDIVEIHMRTAKNGSVSHRGMVTETDVNRPDRVKTDTCLRYFRRVLKLIHRPSTSMSSIGSQSDSECAISQSFWFYQIFMFVIENKIFFNIAYQLRSILY